MQKYNIRFTPDAERDIQEIYDYIAIEKGMAELAITYVRKLQKSCYRLETSPMRGRNRDDIRPALRILPLNKTTVAAFEIDETHHTVLILGIFAGGRDYEMMLSDSL